MAKRADGTDCGVAHRYEYLIDRTAIMTIGERRYTVCAHPVGKRGYCGELIDVTDGNIYFCCGGDHEHMPILGID